MAALCKLEEIAEDLAPYIKELHDFMRSRGVAFGCAADVGPVVERLEADADFRDEMSSMVRAIMYRQRDGLERGELFELVLAAVGGAAMEERSAEFEEPVVRLRAFVNGVFRSRWSSAVEDRRGTELHGAMLASASEERQWTVPRAATERKQRSVMEGAESGGVERSAVVAGSAPGSAAGSVEAGHSSTTLFYRARVVAAEEDGAEWPVEDELVSPEAMPVNEEVRVATVEGAEVVGVIETPVIAEQAVEIEAIKPDVVVEPEVVAESLMVAELSAETEPEVVAVETHEIVEPVVAGESRAAVEATAVVEPMVMAEAEVVAEAPGIEEPGAAVEQVAKAPAAVEAAASSVRAAAAPVVPAVARARSQMVARARSQMKAAHAHEFSWFEPIEPRRRSMGWVWVVGICAVAAAVALFAGAARRGWTAVPAAQVQSAHPARIPAAARVAAGQAKPSPAVQRLSDAQVAAMIAQAEQRGRESAGNDEDPDEAELVKESEALAAAHAVRIRRVKPAAASGTAASASVGTQPPAPVVRPSQPVAASAAARTAGASAPVRTMTAGGVDGASGAVRVPRYAVPPRVMAGRLVYAPQPKYPALAKLMHVEGRVVVAEVVARDGQVVEAKVLSGHKLLRGAALRAVEERRYRPYVLDDRASEVVTTATVDFKLGR